MGVVCWRSGRVRYFRAEVATLFRFNLLCEHFRRIHHGDKATLSALLA
jgi:hypothetical protein